MKRLDPKYVCSRCQGMEDDERIVTFCPSCAELQKDVVLRLCPKCGFDFRTKAGAEPLWSAVSEEVAASEAATDAATPVADAAPAADAALDAPPAPSPAPRAAPSPPLVAAPPPSIPAPTAPPAIAAWPNPTDVPVGAPTPGKHGGKVCQLCRREYPSLWRLVIRTPSGYEERFACGTSVTCQMTSLVPAVQI